MNGEEQRAGGVSRGEGNEVSVVGDGEEGYGQNGSNRPGVNKGIWKELSILVLWSLLAPKILMLDSVNIHLLIPSPLIIASVSRHSGSLRSPYVPRSVGDERAGG